MIRFIRYISHLYRFYKVASRYSDGTPRILNEYGNKEFSGACSSSYFNYKEQDATEKERVLKHEYRLYGSLFHKKKDGSYRREPINITVSELATAEKTFQLIKKDYPKSFINMDFVNRQLIKKYS